MIRCTLKLDGENLVAHAGPRDVDLMREVPGLRHDHRTGCWRGPAKWATALILRAQFGDALEVAPEVDEWGWRQVQDEHLAHHIKAGTYRQGMAALPWAEDLLDFQVDSVALMSEFGTVINADEMGAGKTVQTARALVRAQETEGRLSPFPALVIATSSMLDTWAEELEKWVPGCEPVIVRGSAKKRAELIQGVKSYTTLASDESAKHVLIMTWGSFKKHTRIAGYGSIALKRCIECEPRDGDPLLKVSSCEVHKRELNGDWLRSVIADEAHKAKDPKSVQTRALWALGHSAVYRWPLTGTPVAGAPEDLWALLHFCDPVSWPSKTKYIERYTIHFVGNHGLEVFGFNPQTKEELDRLIAPYFVCRPKSLVMTNLPKPLPPQVRWVEQSTKERKAYTQMRDNLMANVGDDVLTASDPLVRDTRLRQMACGLPVIEIDEEGETQVVALSEPSCKTEALLEVIEEMGGKPLVVFAESKLLLRLASEVLTKKKLAHVSITGDVDSADRAAHVAAFQRKEVPIILVSMGAGAEGITLTAADTAVFLQRSYRMVLNRQAEARIHRHGQTEQVQIIDIITKDTIESEVFDKAQDKEEVLNDVTKDPEWVKRTLEGDK